MDTDVLRWFIAVAEGATVTEVSELERVTQSGVSRALARLESSVGTPLLERSGRTLRLTRAGEVFKPYADQVVRELRSGLDAVAQFVSPATGSVAVAFQGSLGSWLVPDLVRSFRAEQAGVRFELTQVDDELHGLPLNGGKADLELGTRRFRTGSEAARPGDIPVWTRRIGDEPLRLAVPRDHRLANLAGRAAGANALGADGGGADAAGPGGGGSGGIPLTAANGEPFIALRAGSALRKLGDDLCAAAGFRPRVVFEGDHLSNLRGLVAASLGVAIVPAPRAGTPEAAPGPVLYLPLLDEGALRDMYLTWPAGRPLLPAPDLFRKHIVRMVSAGRIRLVSQELYFA
jgi:DNA-binding transcriptional LysR family regulator